MALRHFSLIRDDVVPVSANFLKHANLLFRAFLTKTDEIRAVLFSIGFPISPANVDVLERGHVRNPCFKHDTRKFHLRDALGRVKIG